MKRTILFSAITLALAGVGFGASADSSPTFSPVKAVDTFESLFGVTEGKRRNHTKGFCFTGVLEPQDKAIQKYSHSALFTGESKVVGRFSHSGGNPNKPDNVPAEYGMGLSITGANGDKQLMAMGTVDFFPVATPGALVQMLQAKKAGKEAMAAFAAKTPEFQNFQAHNSAKKKMLKPFEGSTYNSINSFYLVDKDGSETAVRWSFVPTTKRGIVAKPAPDFFFDNIQQNLASGPLEWNMVVTLANDDDVINNAAIAWKGEHTQIVAAKLTIKGVSTEADGQCSNINYDPTALAPGMKISNDPILIARSQTYAVGFARRMTEQRASPKN